MEQVMAGSSSDRKESSGERGMNANKPHNNERAGSSQAEINRQIGNKRRKDRRNRRTPALTNERENNGKKDFLDNLTRRSNASKI